MVWLDLRLNPGFPDHRRTAVRPPITKTIQVRLTRHAGHCGRSKDELIRDVLLWTLSHGQAKIGQPAGTYLQQLCVDTGCSKEDLLGDRDECEKGSRKSVIAARHDDNELYCHKSYCYSWICQWFPSNRKTLSLKVDEQKL